MKTNMKRVLSLLLVLAMVFALAACGGETNKPAEGEKQTEESQKPADKTEEPATDEPKALTGDINVYTRDASSGTREAFEKGIGFGEGAKEEGKDPLTNKAAEVDSNGTMAVNVGKDANGIGYVSLTTDFEGNNLKAVKYEGVAASNESVLDGSYKLQRPFSFTLRKSGDFTDEKVEQLAKAFIAFITESQEGMEAVADAGGILDMTNAKPWEEVKKDYPIVDEDNSKLQIRTGGSTSVEKTIKEASKAFTTLAGNVEFVMAHTGSGDGWKRTLGPDKDSADAIDIGFASRDFKEEEPVQDSAVAAGKYCLDAVVVAIEKNNAIEDFNKDQLFKIFTGQVTKWEEIK